MVKKIVFSLLAIFISFSLNLRGQDSLEVAPNFKVTDIYGVFHNLYTDYLPQGKFVFLDFFTNTCTFCQYYAPIIDTAYRELGCGCGNIDFFAMNLSSYSDDQSVLEFITKYGITFTPVSAEGGSDYTGEIYDVNYTPYFILIAPDTTILRRNLQFSTAQQLIDSLISFGVVPTDCQKAEMRYYELWDANKNVVGIGNIDRENNRIYVEVADTVDITNLTAFFVASANSTVYIDSTIQYSGKTSNDFSDTVLYTIKAEVDTIEKNWQVIVSQYPTTVEKTKEILIYPNPTNGILFFNEKFEGKWVKIYNLEGKAVAIKQIHKTKINLEELPSGIYILSIETKSFKIYKK